MKLFSALKYYITSIPTLLSGVNFYAIPLLLIDNKMLLNTKAGISFYVKALIEIWTIKEVVLDRQYEDHREIRENDIVIDIGAAIGEFSIHAAKKADTVYAFEMVIESIERLQDNIKINNCTNINVIQQRVQSLGDLFGEHKIEKCDFLKIDCEGCEYTIFENVTPAVLDKIEYIAMEVHFFSFEMQEKYKALIEMLSAGKI
jgi:predicted nucleic-acid-binding Zn-ribbon protein